jgi:flagellar hook protein FlgE
MITAQRAFQANSQMIQTEDQITQTVINMRQ